MTTLGQVKLNGEYDVVDSFDPEYEDIGIGTRWLNVDSGESFEQTDATPTWVQIETALDAKIEQVRAATFKRVFRECVQTLAVQRQVALQESPDTITRNDLYYLSIYVSMYAEWTIATPSISSDDIVGLLEDFEYEDYVWIQGSKRNDGLYSIESVDADGLTFDEALSGTADRFVVLLVTDPVDLDIIIGRMVWYDVTERAKRLGLSSERIGTYSYTLADELIGGLRYPTDVVAGIDSYLNAAPLVDVDYIP